MKMSKKKTAVDLLIDKLNKRYGNNDFVITFENEIAEAKELERQQIVDAHDNGYIDGGNNKNVTSEQYYSGTYE